MVGRARELGMNALAITDHGNLYGALEFYEACREAGIKPIIGYEAYVAPASRFDRSAGAKGDTSYHLTLLAANRAGFENLMQLSSKAFLEGFYHKPRIDRELLEAHREGIICLSGCVSGELSRTLLSGNTADEALARGAELAAWFARVFGERYFIEIQNNGLELQRQALELSIELARRMGLPTVATCDAHYVRREDAEAQDVLLCINTGKFRTDTNRMRMEGDEFYLRSPEEMYAAFAGHDGAVARTQQIADGIDLELELGARHFPTFVPPNGQRASGYLRELCEAGLRERYATDGRRWRDDDPHSGELSEEVRQRLDRELDVIEKLGFSDYFLIVWDFVRYAWERNIPCRGRGSGVGSLVCYALKITPVCPLRYGLLFERFLDENRREAPDIDIDFCKDRRGEVIQYVKDKYGEANVAQIGTFGTLAARAAIRDVGRTLGMPIFRVDQVVAMVPDQIGITLQDALGQSDELRRAYDSDGEIHELIDLARKVEGLARNVGTHAAAVVIAERPVGEYVPLQYVKGKTEVITQWAMGDVERAGLLKMDFLGLRNLTILAKAVELVEQSQGKRIEPHTFPLDDAETFALLCRGETKGIFQLESGGIRDLLQRMKPDHFRDIIATNALYRPGPLEGGMVDDYIEVKHARKQAYYPHPVMTEVLEETHGVMVYQEQVMQILNRLGGIELADAYSCIKAISKKKLPVIAKFREEFIEGASQRGLDKKKADELFSQIEKFAGYGFNKSHSTAYALIAYQTAYLKAHYPVEFMAALLSGDIPARNFKSKDSLVEHLEDCPRMGVDVVPPDVNRSEVDFAVAPKETGAVPLSAREQSPFPAVEGKILFGLSAIKGCGSGAAEAIVAARKTGGPFASLFDFCERVDPQACGRATIETLVKAGAFDSLGARRAQLMAAVERAMLSGAAVLADRRSGQRGLFEADGDDAATATNGALPELPEYNEKERLAMEKEVLGFYLTSHPLAEHEAILRTYSTHTSGQLAKLEPRSEVLVGGMLAAVKFSHTKNPRPGSSHTKYAMWDLEDFDGLVRCIIWPEQFAEFGHLVKADAILALRASVDRRPGSDEVNLIVQELIALDELPARYTSGVVIRLLEDVHGAEALLSLREIVRGYPGNKPLRLRLELAAGGSVTLDCVEHGVTIDPELRRRVDELLGPGNFRLLGAAPRTAPPPHATNGRRRALARS
jgi:DNA polymerase-3 subunit alpha